MPDQLVTTEFSICFSPLPIVTKKIESLRHILPPSPYRDDPPHITLLRGIRSASFKDDDTLRANFAKLLQLSDSLPLEAIVEGIENLGNEMYSETSLVLLAASPKLSDCRKKITTSLLSNDYSVEAKEQKSFRPHVTIRLGIPLHGGMLSKAEELFPKGSKITFCDWFLFRLVMKGNARTFKILELTSKKSTA